MIGAILVQAGITLFGVSAIFLLGSKNKRLARWGLVAGICSEPFWFTSAYMAQQWGVLVLVFVYTFGYARGIHNNFGKHHARTSTNHH